MISIPAPFALSPLRLRSGQASTSLRTGLSKPVVSPVEPGERRVFPHPARLLLLPLFFLGLTATTSVPTTQEVEEALTCQCSCGLTVHNCNHLQCGFAVPAKQTVAEQVSQGKGKEEITALFVARYGEKVLSSPTTSGFNLAAWITPFLAVLVGGALLGLASLRWTRRREQDAQEKLPVPLAANQYRDRLKKELETFDV